jgi:hypothetical protein
VIGSLHHLCTQKAAGADGAEAEKAEKAEKAEQDFEGVVPVRAQFLELVLEQVLVLIGRMDCGYGNC